MKAYGFLLSVLWMSVSVSALAGANTEVSMERIKTELMCTCGCPHQLGQCGDECGTAPKLIQDVEGLLQEGKSDEDVFEIYQARYGAAVRAVPKADGFNLMAWILPFMGLAFGGATVWRVAIKLRPELSNAISEKPAANDEEGTDER